MPHESTRRTLGEMRAKISGLVDRMDAAAPVSANSVFRVAAAKQDRFSMRVDALAAAAQARSGLRAFDYRRHGDGGAVEFVIDESWETPGAFRAYWSSSALKHFQERAEGYVVSSPEIKVQSGSAAASGASELAPPQTGQVGAWDTYGNPIPVAGSGQDAEFRAGRPVPSPRFHDNRDGTVTDNLTNLTWLQDADAFGEIKWMEAMRAARALASGSHGLKDHSSPGDWRAPNIRELFSLMHFGSDKPPILPRNHPFKQVRPAIYWTSTSLTPAPHITW